MKILFLLTILSNLSNLSYGINFNKPIISEISKKNILSYEPSKLITEIAKETKNNFGETWTINDFIKEASKNNIESVSIIQKDNEINSIIAIDNLYNKEDLPINDNIHIIQTGIDKFNEIALNTVINKNIYYDIFNIPENNLLIIFNILQNIFVLYILISLLSFLFNRFSNNPMNMLNKNSDNEIINSDDVDIGFNDVAGCDEAKYELQEIVEFLKNPLKFSNIGAKIPKGVLLEGPPGTGKTLLAKAVAGEAGVSYISVSASQFIEMYVGLGASRVRKLFETAKENKPCVIFIDEIDAIGKKRGNAFNSGGNEEREQTLNQILTNMDGFDKDEGIIIIGATNRIDILDDALIRSGRFDRKIKVSLPDEIGRKQILKVHLKNKQIDSNINYEEISKLTSGFSGADLANVANEAAILAVRDNSSFINNKYLLDAFEKLTIGLTKYTDNRNNNTLNMIAYHEVGHALTANLFKEFFTINKVTINSNINGAGGFTLFIPKDNFNEYPTKKYILANMVVSMGGRAAEMILFNKTKSNNFFSNIKNLDITTGSSNDLIQANKLARQYIDLFGINNFNNNYKEYYEKIEIYKDIDNYDTLSDNSKDHIDKETSLLINYAYNTAIDILVKNNNLLTNVCNDLLMHKTLNSSYFDELYCIY